LRELREGAAVTRYAWDAAGRLGAVELPDGRRAEYAYDPLGRRLETREYDRGQLRERTRFVWDGDTIAHAIRVRAVAEGDPIVEERTFCFEDGGFVPWAQCDEAPDEYGGRAKAWGYFVNDPIGTPDELVDGAGVVCAELKRQAWGKTEAGEATPLRFQGQHEDQPTGLHYNGHRYYDPEAGLYVSPDPLGLSGGLRAYGYCDNPTGWIDPLGLMSTPLNKGGFTVYGLYAPGASTPYYVGMTNEIARRRCEHQQDERLGEGARMQALPGSRNLTYAEARGHEQAYMERYGTKSSWPGNLRNSVDPNRRDPRGQAMHQEYWKKKGGF
jgi:RHS repeat-associated protein